MGDDTERSEWRRRGLEAGRAYAVDLATRMQDSGADDPAVQDLIASIGLRLQGEAQEFRDIGTSEDAIEEYTRAVVETVMLGMHALRRGSDTPSE